MKINIVVPPLAPDRYTGGIWCILQHAQQLGLRGHRVQVVPTHPCAIPEWFPRPWAFALLRTPPRQALGRGAWAMVRAGTSALSHTLHRHGSKRAVDEAAIRRGVGLFGIGLSNFGSHGMRMGGAVDHLTRVLPAADLTLATDTETAWLVALVGSGRLAYFAQHYEPYFWNERLGGEASRREAELSYGLGLQLLANSPWLQGMLQAAQPSAAVRLCPNAIDHRIFFGAPRARAVGEPMRVISYGGRGARWKGFAEACEAMRLVKASHPDMAFEWSVYGDALLPPDNPICPYRPLGFLEPAALAEAYRQNHVLLSASWYESFPLFPIEAMACGLAAITTQPGTELFAQHDMTALVVPPKQPEAIAAAVVRLGEDDALRLRLGSQGQERSLQYTWDRAGLAMESALTAIHGAPSD